MCFSVSEPSSTEPSSNICCNSLLWDFKSAKVVSSSAIFAVATWSLLAKSTSICLALAAASITSRLPFAVFKILLDNP